MFFEYFFIIKYFFYIVIFVSLLFLFSIFSVYQQFDFEKYSTYECGFNPYGDARIKFDIKFYLIGILFIISDLEVSYLFPWIFALPYIGHIGFCGMLVFMVLITLGFAYE
jgi:NADH-quinone oxidoreductase subunit A